jgi:branched-chain amino acid transport system substrate-binding protein
LKRRNLFVVVMLLLPLLLGACSLAQSSSNSSSSSGLPASGQPIVIGGTLGLTGAFAGPSADYKVIYNYWVNQVNSHGGLLGHQVKLIIYDDESNPSTAQSLYQRLINVDKVNLLLAPYTTYVGGAILPNVEANRMVLWNGGFVGIKLFENSNWMVSSYTYQEPDYSRGIFQMIDSLPQSEKPIRVGIVTEQNPFTLKVRDGFNGVGGAINFAKQRGMQIVMNQEYPANTTDFSGLIQQAKAANVDLFLALSLPDPAAQIARTAHSLGFKPKIYCACGSQVTTLKYWSGLGPAGNGIFSTTLAEPSDNFPGINALYTYMSQARGETEFSSYSAVAYAILQVLQQAVEGAKTLNQGALRNYVLSHTFDTVAGTLKYDSHGMPQFNAAVIQYVNGHNQITCPAARATAQPQLQAA